MFFFITSTKGIIHSLSVIMFLGIGANKVIAELAPRPIQSISCKIGVMCDVVCTLGVTYIAVEGCRGGQCTMRK